MANCAEETVSVVALCRVYIPVTCHSDPPSAETLHPSSTALRAHLGREAQSNENLFSISSELEEQESEAGPDDSKARALVLSLVFLPWELWY